VAPDAVDMQAFVSWESSAEAAFVRTLKGERSMNNMDHMKIGRYQSWMENGTLKLYCHEFGAPNGFSCKLSAEEAKGLLELLSRHRQEIDQALYEHEAQHAHHYA
jgi:hypothetical protein